MGPMPEAVLESDAFYDAGEVGCSGPALKDIARLLDELQAGGSLEIRTATTTGRDSLRAFCRMRGFPIEAEDVGPDSDRILIRKG